MTRFTDRAVTPDSFAQLMLGLGVSAVHEPTFLDQAVLAFSGGSDSLALLYLLTQWRCGSRPLAVIVDHCLRPKSDQRALFAAQSARHLGAQPVILVWDGEKPGANIQAKARQARYRLIEDLSLSRGMKYIFLAHHLDDQAETFVMRLIRGSGVDGLSCMAPVTPSSSSPGLLYLRPLLHVPKRALSLTLEQAGLEDRVVEDPSNQDETFARVRVRKLSRTLATLGLRSERLALAAEHMRRAREALEKDVSRFMNEHTNMVAGSFTMDLTSWLALPTDIQNRVLIHALVAAGRGPYKPRLASLERVASSLRGGTFRKATLAHCVILLEENKVRIFPEEWKGRVGPPGCSPRRGVC